MLFNSIEFVVFLPIVFVAYWFLFKSNLRLQNLFLLVASYVFYGWWDEKFLLLIVLSSLVDFSIGRELGVENKESRRKLLLWTSLAVNLGLLGFFKYYNFFVESFSDAFTLLGSPIEVSRLEIILPVGISFYTFQTLSYTIDIYKRKLEPSRDPIAFFAFVSFFPQLVAGPIERASNLLPQFYCSRNFDIVKAKDGLRQILWGLFKKVVIADNCSVVVNEMFADHESFSGVQLIVGAVFFAFQIYGDFSGYSDIAIGTARLFGFSLMQNFAFPYFSRDIAEFWRRWHISLSTWFRDYLYIPLGGSRGGTAMKVRNTFIIFLVSGFWHGANWTFIIWGLLNALYFLPLLLRGANRSNLDTIGQGQWLPSAKDLLMMCLTFGLTIIAWIFFRAESVSQALSYLNHLFLDELLQSPGQIALLPATFYVEMASPFIAGLLAVEWWGRTKQHALEGLAEKKLRWVAYVAISAIIFFYGRFDNTEFIYFQF